MRLALLFLLVTNIHRGPVPPLSEFIAINHGTPVDFKMFNTINAATSFTNASTSEEMIKVRVPVLPV